MKKMALLKLNPIMRNLITLCMCMGFALIYSISYGQVKIQDDSITIPTYVIGEPNSMPRFYEGALHQGVQRRVYPYPMNDMLGTEKEDRNYHIIYVENDFIQLGIMPGMGGRIYYAQDKTNDYVWFYRNHVVKPSLIGMVGNWISGSNAWGFPHHHGPNTVKPMDYSIEDHEDGSRTIWIANTDRRHRVRILVGYTIYPNSSIVEMTIKPSNRTATANSFLFWANPSVHVDSTYQVIFPPSVQYVTHHAKREMTTWPISDGPYSEFDYTNVDISMWKNVGVPSSFFSWDPKEDYFAGYDHGKKAGTAWVGNHHIAPGMKYWAWGNNPGGDRANNGLTDDDGHYIELMAGFYTNNQPDYSWIQPYESKSGKMIWFPIRDLGGLKYANRNGALNLEITKNNLVEVRMNATSSHQSAKVVLKAGKQVLFEKIIDISPARPYSVDIPLTSEIEEDDLDIILLTIDNQPLLSYRPGEHHPPKTPEPTPVQPPASPEKINTIEELYLTGLRLDQFYNATLDPMPYYNEALRRDPNDYRVNTQLGILSIKHHNWEEAQEKLQTAVNRITFNHTRPKDGEALYYLGIAQRALGKKDQAYDNLYRATWSSAWHSAAYYQLAELDCEQQAYHNAIEHLDRALSTNAKDNKAIILKALVLRKLGKLDGAEELVQSILKRDMINHNALNEMYLIQLQKETSEAKVYLDKLSTIMRDDVQSYLELATDYGNGGFFDEAKNLLERLEKTGENYPMLYYYLGYYWEKLGEEDKALSYYKQGSGKPYKWCFPFRAESITVLEHAIQSNPQDAKAPYYLGNLLYEHQPDRSIEWWEKSRQLDDSFYIVHRNLGIAFQEVGMDYKKAMTSLEKAVKINSKDPRLLFELDNIYELIKTPSIKKYNLLKENFETTRKRTETLLRLATRSVEIGEYKEAIEIIENNNFPQFEGGREKQDTYLDACALLGINSLKSKDFSMAISYFKTALDYPVGRFGRSRWAQFNFLLGRAYEYLGEKTNALEYYQSAINSNVLENSPDQIYMYYRGLAMQKFGDKKNAEQIFRKMLQNAQKEHGSNFFTQFAETQTKNQELASNHYLIGLAYLGLGDTKQAKFEFNKALEYNPYHIWSKEQLKSFE